MRRADGPTEQRKSQRPEKRYAPVKNKVESRREVCEIIQKDRDSESRYRRERDSEELYGLLVNS
jgi:hypothetical protein